MRKALRNVIKADREGKEPSVSRAGLHPALSYNSWAEVCYEDGKVPNDQRSPWLERIAAWSPPEDYQLFFKRWSDLLHSAEGPDPVELELQTPLLIGSGNGSAAEVGLTLHRTWGVPVIPGSALKGVARHYLEAQLRSQEQDRSRAEDSEGLKTELAGDQTEILIQAFGSADSPDSPAKQGLVCFMDALYVPSSGPGKKPYRIDVLTPHQRRYYEQHGKHWPNDYDEPNPVNFISVAPGVRFLVAVVGAQPLAQTAFDYLLEVLERWGVGAKRAQGYGLLERSQSKNEEGAEAAVLQEPTYKAGNIVTVEIISEVSKKGKRKARTKDCVLEGVIQNSDQIPAEIKTGEEVTVRVMVAKRTKSQFEYLPTQVDVGR